MSDKENDKQPTLDKAYRKLLKESTGLSVHDLAWIEHFACREVCLKYGVSPSEVSRIALRYGLSELEYADNEELLREIQTSRQMDSLASTYKGALK